MSGLGSCADGILLMLFCNSRIRARFTSTGTKTDRCISRIGCRKSPRINALKMLKKPDSPAEPEKSGKEESDRDASETGKSTEAPDESATGPNFRQSDGNPHC